MLVNGLEILVGCDPELFVKKGGEFVSAHGLVPGTKKDPHPVPCGAIQIDGMALEFNINASATEDDFVTNITAVMAELVNRVPDYEVCAVPTADFSQAVFDAAPPEALELGCDPDYDAYTGRANEKPDGKVMFRTASGHIHIGWTNGADIADPDHIAACRAMCKELDILLGIPSMLWDKDNKRRTLYGKAGCYRVKSYGVEYRTLSNRWLSDEKLMRFVFQQVMRAVSNLTTGKKVDQLHQVWPVEIARELINDGRSEQAMRWSDYSDSIPPCIEAEVIQG